jgi:hypothetical protein
MLLLASLRIQDNKTKSRNCGTFVEQLNHQHTERLIR